ncbi:MAG: hypothetical protein PVJ21_22200, partial [Anaerolineales bacterium]
MKITHLVLILIVLLGIPACSTPTSLSTPDPALVTPEDTPSEPNPIAQATMPVTSETPSEKPFYLPLSMRVVYVRDGNVWSWTEADDSVQLTGTGDISTARLSDDGQL